MEKQRFASGITIRSVCACLTCLIMAGIYTQHIEVYLAIPDGSAEHVLPIPGMGIFVPLILLSALSYALFRVRLLDKPEMLCVLFSILLAVPMMTQGMWHRFVGLIAATPKGAYFQYLDAFNDKLWPHGKNLAEGLLNADSVHGYVVSSEGKPAGEKVVVEWKKVEYETGVSGTLPQISNASVKESRSVRIVIPLKVQDGQAIKPTELYLFSVLARGNDLGPDSFVFGRLIEDDNSEGVEAFNSKSANDTTFVHQKGFVRLGAYGVSLSSKCHKNIALEIGLSGKGSVIFADPKFYSVQALQDIYSGRKVVSAGKLGAIPVECRDPGLVVKPDSLFSLKGVLYILQAYIPIKDWINPMLAWGSFILILMAGFLAVNVIMRQQWVDHERYLLPNAQIPIALMGLDEAGSALPAIWKNKAMWAGFCFALIFGIMSGWSLYNPLVPSPAINVPLKPYFMDASWGGLWDTSFQVKLIWVSIAIFFDLNMLASILIGYWLYRFLFLAKTWMDIGSNPSYPWRNEQTVGAYLGYFAIALLFARRYLWSVLKKAIAGGKDELDVLSSRNALVLLLAAFSGSILWANYLDVPVLIILIYFAFLLAIGFVAAKMRAECGLVFSYFTPYNAMLFMGALGGVYAFGASGMLVVLILSGFLTASAFFLIPGAQLELIHLGRGIKMNPRHVIYACLFGLFGGLFVGGWVFLSNAYSYGGDSLAYQWAFNQDFFFADYRAALANATSRMHGGAAAETGGMGYGTWAMMISGIAVAAVAALRQFFAGFWLHPGGFLLGSTFMAEGVWGSVLAALIIRYLVLQFGGATAVRDRLKPFFVGCFLGCLAATMIFHALAAYLKFTGSGKIFGTML